MHLSHYVCDWFQAVVPTLASSLNHKLNWWFGRFTVTDVKYRCTDILARNINKEALPIGCSVWCSIHYIVLSYWVLIQFIRDFKVEVFHDMM